MKLINKIKRKVNKSSKFLTFYMAILSMLMNMLTPFLLSYSYVAHAQDIGAPAAEEVKSEEPAPSEAPKEEPKAEESAPEESAPAEEAAPAEEPQASEEVVEVAPEENPIIEEAVVEEPVVEEAAPVVENPVEEPAIEPVVEPAVEPAAEEPQGDILPDGASDYRPEEGEVEPASEPTTDTTDVTDPTVVAIEETPKVIEQECLTEGQQITDSAKEEWNVDSENKYAETINKVKLGVKYIFPEDEKVTVTFTCLPKNEDDRSILKIQKVKVEDLKLPDGVETNAEYAYDITTPDMDNESFKYNLELPKPEGVEAKVSYIEKDLSEVTSEEVKAEDVKSVEEKDIEQKTEDSDVKVGDLDHFTIFIVTTVGNAPVLSSGVVNDQPEVTVAPSTVITIKIKATTSGSTSWDDWRSSQYKIGDGSWTCADTGDHTSDGTYTESFDINAPASDGTYNLSLKVYNGDGCTGGSSDEYVMTNAITVATPVENCGYNCPIIHFEWTTEACPQGYTHVSQQHDGYCYKGNSPHWPEDYSAKVVTNHNADVQYEKSQDPTKCHRPSDSTLVDTYGMDNDAKSAFKSDNKEWLEALPIICACTDTDVDGVCDDVDNCPSVANPTQSDDDHDGLGNACDAINNYCGDGYVYENEQCDDGNKTSGDGCSETCQSEFGTINAFEYRDDNKNQLQDPGEPATPFYDVSLYQGGGCSGSPISTKTYADFVGNLVPFGSLVPGTYSLQETLPGDGTIVNTTPLCQDATVGIGETKQIDFGNFRIQQITVCVSNDLNGDGIWQSGEPRLPGWTINLAGPENLSEVTGGDGCVRPNINIYGGYVVTEILQPGWTQTFPTSPQTGYVDGSMSTGLQIFNHYEGLCGDGTLDTNLQEQCDDGNIVDGDGCSSTCTTEALAYCGDGVINQPSEQCDGNARVGGDQVIAASPVSAVEDFCTSACVLVPIYDGGHVCPEGTTKSQNPIYTGTISSTDSDGENISLGGGTYLFEAIGDYGYGGDTPNNTINRADAGYATGDAWNTRLDGVLGITAGATYRGITSLLSDMGTGTVGLVDWGSYDSDHKYQKVYSGGGHVRFLISDWYDTWYSGDAASEANKNQGGMHDNAGSITLNVYECEIGAVCGNGKVEQGEECDGTAGITSGQNFCSYDCKLVPLYDGSHVCSGDKVPVLYSGPFQVSSTDTDGITVPVVGGKEYLFEASGTFIPTNAPGYLSDAAYTLVNGSLSSQYGIHGTPPDYAAHALLGNFGSGVGVIDWGDYQEDHIYKKAYSFGSNYDINFVIGDRYANWFDTVYQNQSGMNDNSGELSLTVYECTTPVCGNGKLEPGEECDGRDGIKEGENFCASTCKLIPIYDGEHACSGNTVPVKVGDTHFIGSQDSNGINISLTGGQEYLFKVSGTYNYDKNNSGKFADGAYGTQTNWSSTRTDIGIWGTNKGVISLLGDLGNGVGVVEWDNDTTVDGDHAYEKAFTPTNDISAQFLISDWYSDWYNNACKNQSCMTDNLGGLNLEVYECKAAPVTINAQKVVCTDEVDLPNWGQGGSDITSTTAQDWVSSHRSCSLVPDWKFQWSYDGVGNPGDNIGEGGIGWNTFGPTDGNGVAEVEISDLGNSSTHKLWFREVLEDGYLPFTFGSHPDNSDNVSAEFYCNNDVLNYDNWEWIDDPQFGQTYYCVAFNFQVAPKIAVDKQGPEFAEKDEPITYTYAVTNPGNVPLSNVSVADDKCSPVNYQNGDTNSDSKLDLGETWNYSCTTTPTWTFNTEFLNTATAVGYYGQTQVQATDDYKLYSFILRKDVKLEGGEDFSDPNTQFDVNVQVGDTVIDSVKISEATPAEMWVAEGSYQFCEVNMPAGYTPHYTDGCLTFNTGTYPDWTEINYLKPVTIVATKIVCDTEADLPNWGEGPSNNITAITAQRWINTHPNCHLQDGWQFQWGDDSVSNPGDATLGEVAGWNTFGPTGVDGTTTANIYNFGNTAQIKVREVLQSGFLPFTYLTNGGNSNNVSAEIYCSDDVLNYDNDDRITGPQYGQTYYCVAFNVLNYGKVIVNKFQDDDNDGYKDESEPLLSGWNITLDQTTQVTDANGQTTFSNIIPGIYGLTESAIPTGWTQTNIYCDSDIREDGLVAVIDNGNQHNVNVGTNQTVTCYIGNIQLGSVHGYKWNDYDGDGSKDENESLLSGWTVNLFKWNGTGYDSEPVATMNTDSSDQHFGWYWFEDLLPGQYKVCEIPQGGWNQTFPINTEGNCHVITLPSGNSNGFEFPEQLNAIAGPVYSFGNQQLGIINVTKYDDADGSGTRNGEEKVLSDWIINLSNGSNEVTDQDGHATFSNLAPNADYVLGETMQEGWYQTDITCEVDQSGPGELITAQGEAYGHHGQCAGWNGCGDAATCAQWACEVKGYDHVVSYGAEKPCTQFNNCNLFYSRGNVQMNWGNWCPVMGVTDIKCSNTSGSDVALESRIAVADIEGPDDSKQITVNPGDVWNCSIGNRRVNPVLHISKENFQGGVAHIGDLIKYKIMVWVTEFGLEDVKVKDLLPKGFKYVGGSWTAFNSDGNLPVPEPVYASPGTWDVGDLEVGKPVTLEYTAEIQNDVDAGLYKDLAWTEGDDILSNNVVGLADPTGYVATNFVGTQVQVDVENEPEKAKADTKVNEEVKEEVLGASDVRLPGTGISPFVVRAILSAFALGGLLLILGGISKLMKKRKGVLSILAIMIFGMLSIGQVKAESSNLFVRLEKPESTAIEPFKITYVVMDLVGNRDITVKCYVDVPSDHVFQTDVIHTSGGDTGTCNVTDAVLDDDGDYKFYVNASAGDPSDSMNSETFTVTYDSKGPGKPQYIEKDKKSDCKNEITLKTADDNGQTSYVEVYREDNKEFTVSDGNRIETISLGSDEKYTFDDEFAGGDCGKKFYYAVRAFDSSGNASKVRSEEITTTTTKTVEGETTEETGALLAEGGQVLGTGGATGGEKVVLEGTSGEQGSVLGQEASGSSQTGAGAFVESLTSKWWLWIGALVIISAIVNAIRKKRSGK